MDSIRRLEEIFAHFPGIGPRQAKRFVYYLLNRSTASIREFTDLVAEVKKSTTECVYCRRFFTHKDQDARQHGAHANGPGASICSICTDPHRDHETLMIVARDSDFESIEKSGAYKGLYFILGGTVPILDKEPEKRIRLRVLLERLQNAAASPTAQERSTDAPSFKEIILSLNTTPDGEHTEDIVRTALSKVSENPRLSSTKVSVLGRGLSTGAELEYVDADTIKSALQNRH